MAIVEAAGSTGMIASPAADTLPLPVFARMWYALRDSREGGAVAKKRSRAPKVVPTTKRKPPYVACVRHRGPVTIWLVDGAYVRKNIDEEFSNFGHHYAFPEIPRQEIWLDKEADPDEQRFFIRHALEERRLMAAGKDYDTARLAACAAERRMRAKAGDIQRVARGKALPDPARVHVRLWKTMPTGVQVWIVKGRLVRSVFDIEFTEGGHEHVYEYVPHGEVWIDDDVEDIEKSFVLFHELHERNLMEKGMDYDAAHDESSKLERHYRKHPNELHEALAAEGWE